MINYILSSENENISINEDKKSNYNGQNNPILLTDSQIRNTNESFDLSLGNDFEEISCLFPFNIKNIKNPSLSLLTNVEDFLILYQKFDKL